MTISALRFILSGWFLPVKGVLTTRVEAELGSAHDAPSNAVSGVVQAAEWTLQTQLVTCGHKIIKSTVLSFLTVRPSTFGKRFSAGTTTSSITI